MTITLPLRGGLLTVEDYVALGDDETLRWSELQEGVLVVAPGPTTGHQYAGNALNRQIFAQLPADMVVLYDMDVDLQLAPPGGPGTVRQPDLAVVTRAEATRSMRERTLLRASGVMLAVEIISPGSVRTDQLIKRAEYADAGIPHYWVVDLDAGPSLTACTLVDGAYRDDGPATGQVSGDRPFAFHLDLEALS